MMGQSPSTPGPFVMSSLDIIVHYQARALRALGLFEAKNRFSAERKNARFSVIPARTRSVVLLGHFFDGPDGSTKFR